MIISLLHKKVYYRHVKPYPSFEQKRKEEGINDMRTLLLQHFSPCTMQFHLKTPYEWFNLHNFPSENPPSILAVGGRGNVMSSHLNQFRCH
jgi:predicted LPLAT superfamily acyltransferase